MNEVYANHYAWLRSRLRHWEADQDPLYETVPFISRDEVLHVVIPALNALAGLEPAALAGVLRECYQIIQLGAGGQFDVGGAPIRRLAAALALLRAPQASEAVQ